MGYVKLREKHLALLVANLPNKNMVEKTPEKYLNPCQMGTGTPLKALIESYPMNTNMTGFGRWLNCQMSTHLTALIESYLMNTNMTGFGHFSKIVASLSFGQK